MPNPMRKNEFRVRDAREQETYNEWRALVLGIEKRSDQIMEELRQFNIEITKQRLSASFADIYDNFPEIPQSIADLHDDLEQFRERSEQLDRLFNADDTPSSSSSGQDTGQPAPAQQDPEPPENAPAPESP